MEQRVLVPAGAVAILDDQRPGRDEPRHVVIRAGVLACSDQAWLRAAQIAAQCVLPEPGGPTRSMTLSGQSGQLSSAA